MPHHHSAKRIAEVLEGLGSRRFSVSRKGGPWRPFPAEELARVLCHRLNVPEVAIWQMVERAGIFQVSPNLAVKLSRPDVGLFRVDDPRDAMPRRRVPAA